MMIITIMITIVIVTMITIMIKNNNNCNDKRIIKIMVKKMNIDNYTNRLNIIIFSLYIQRS